LHFIRTTKEVDIMPNKCISCEMILSEKALKPACKQCRKDDKLKWCKEFLSEYGYDVIKRS